MKAQLLLGMLAGGLLLGAWLRVYLRPQPLPRWGAAGWLLSAVLLTNFGAVQAYSRVGKYGPISEYKAYGAGMMFVVFGAALGAYALSVFPPYREKAGWGGSIGLALICLGALAIVLQWHGLWRTS